MSLVIEITQTSPVVTEPVVTVIEVAGAGPQGAKGDTGDQGPVGPGVPAGGVEFDLIEKASGDDFDTRFTDTPTVRGIQLSTTNPADVETGRIVWNDGDEVPQFRSNGITVDISLEMLARCRNVTGSMIPKGTAVCIVGTSAQRISIAPSDRTEPGSACRTLGLTLEDIANNNFGKVSTFGLVRGLNTAGIDGDEGDELFVGETPGSLTTTPPDAPARRLTVGYLVTKSTTQGRIFVSIRRGVRVDEIDDVQVDSVADGDVIRFDDAAGRWENKPLGTAADADSGDFDAAGSADAVQSNLETHIDDDTNPHQVTAEQVGLGDVPNLNTTDAVNKAHDQNTDTALAAGTADEVTAEEAREFFDSPNPAAFRDPLALHESLAIGTGPHAHIVREPDQVRFYGPPDAPFSGQIPTGVPIGDCQFVYPIIVSSGAARQATISFSFRLRRSSNADEAFICLAVDEGNYIQIGFGRGSSSSRVEMIRAVDGVLTQVFERSGPFGFDALNENDVQIVWRIGRDGARDSVILSPILENGGTLVNSSPFAYSDFNFIGFGSRYSPISEYLHYAAITGDRITSVGSGS